MMKLFCHLFFERGGNKAQREWSDHRTGLSEPGDEVMTHLHRLRTTALHARSGNALPQHQPLIGLHPHLIEQPCCDKRLQQRAAPLHYQALHLTGIKLLHKEIETETRRGERSLHQLHIGQDTFFRW
jgi:hypothetical protein